MPSLVPSALKLLVVRLFGFELVFTLLLWGREVMGREGEGRGEETREEEEEEEVGKD